MIDATVLVREYLLAQPEITALLGTNANGSIYCAYDLPEHFDPTLGPCIQIFRAGGHSHAEITVLLDARLCIRAWADQEQYSTASALYGAINDVLHGLCGYTVTDGTIVRALEADGPLEMTDPDTAWVSMYAFYQVMARPSGSSSLGPSGSPPGPAAGVWYEGIGVPGKLEANGDFYLNLSTGDIYLQVSGAWGSPIGNISGGGGSSEMPSLKFHLVAASGLNATNVKPAPGTLTGWNIFNDTEFPVYLKLYDLASPPTPGSSAVAQTIPIQAGETAEAPPGPGIAYANGIGFAITLGLADASVSGISAGVVVVDLFYQ